MTTITGLSYPNDNNYLTTVKNRGYFILVDRKATNISLLAGGDINTLINENKELFFIFGVNETLSNINITGTRQDIIDALYLSGYSIEIITQLLSTAICQDNINTKACQHWITIFKDRNDGKVPTTQQTTITKPIIKEPTEGEIHPNLTYPVTSNYTGMYIMYLRQLIHNTITDTYLGKNPNFETVPNILQDLFTMYDEIFFGKMLENHMQTKNTRLTITYSDKMTKTGGCCSGIGSSYEIKISQPVILNTFRKGENIHISNGLQCYDRLDCLMNIFEHELIHFIIGIINGKDGKPGHIKGDPIYKSHGIYFRQLMKAYFGHTECIHNLTKDGETNTGQKEDFYLGQYVTYTSKMGVIVGGQISKLNPKRAVVDNMIIPYPLLTPSTKDEVDRIPTILKFLQPTVKNQTSPIKDIKSFAVGDIISYTSKDRGVVTDRIIRINPKTYVVGKYKVSQTMVRTPTQEEMTNFLHSPDATLAIKTKAYFHIGQYVKFTKSKTGEVIIGQIQKLNPTRALINDYNVPYHMLSPA